MFHFGKKESKAMICLPNYDRSIQENLRTIGSLVKVSQEGEEVCPNSLDEKFFPFQSTMLTHWI